MPETYTDSIEEAIARFVNVDLNPKGDREASASVDRNAKRIHVKFRDPFLPLVVFLGDYSMEDMLKNKFLDSVWRSFGTVTDTFYEEHFSYCFISFSSHEEAKLALEKLNNRPYTWMVVAGAMLHNQEAILAAVDCHKDVAGGMKLARLLSDFESKKNETSLIRASWAQPRKSSRDSYGNDDSSPDSYGDDDFYQDNDYEYYDDCPDGEDRFVWNEYCVGRD